MAFYPSSTPTNAGLYVAVDNFSATLNGAIDAVQTTITLSSTTGLPTVGILTIDSEKVHYTGIAGNDITGVTRGFSSTSAAPHSNAATVMFNVVEEHHNSHTDEIIAIATDLRNSIIADLDDGVSPATTAANLKIRLDHIATQLKEINTGSDWKDVVAKRLVDLVALDGSRALTGNLPVGGFKLTGLGAGTTNGDSLRYEQVIGLYLLLTGGTMSGDIAMGGNKVTGLGAATTNGDAVRYEQVINQYLLLTGGTLSGDLDLGGNDVRKVASLNDTFLSGFRNRIINGDMRIDQRNAGAALSITGGSNQYTLDRWMAVEDSDGVFSVQRSTTTPPTGFSHFLRVTTTTADASLAAAQTNYVSQRIEGIYVKDFLFGTASAKTITLSFWVRSSLTGTFSLGIVNGTNTRAYATTYTISVANTWELKTITVVGDTSGTWATDTTAGIRLFFDLGSGSDFENTLNTWTATGDFRVAGSTNVIGTLSATWDLTGVQLEIGSQASSFEYRPDAVEIGLCQRYCEKSYSIDVAPGTNTAVGAVDMTMSTQADGGTIIFYHAWKVEKRAGITGSFWTNGGTSGSWEYARSGASGTITMSVLSSGTSGGNFNSSSAGAQYVAVRVQGHWFVTCEL